MVATSAAPFSLRERIGGFAGKLCLHSVGQAYSYADVLDEAERAGQRLAGSGIARGDVVALCGDFNIQSIGFLLAALELGLIIALVPLGHPAEEQYLRAAGAQWLVRLAGDNANDDFITTDFGRQHEILHALRAADDAGVVIFTSGSTGEPKAAVHQASRLLSKFTTPGKALRTLSFLSFDHVAGVDTLLYTLCAGGALIVPDSRDPETVCKLIDRCEVEVLPASPTFLRLLLLANCHQRYSLASLKIVTYGSEPMDPATLSRLAEELPAPEIIQKYGTTEFGAPRAQTRGRDSLWINLKADEIEHKIIDDVLWVRSPASILGYLNHASPFDRDGWLCTGDLVETDGDWLRILGRSSELINVGGEKVVPGEIEATLCELPYVAEAVVFGEAHPLIGQMVVANVVLAQTERPERTEAAIRKHCLASLPRHKVPADIRISESPLHSVRQKKQRLQKPARP